MADEYQYITESGTILPDTADLLTTVENEYKTVFGSDLIVDANTPQGVLITAEAIARDAVVRNNAALANQINPNISGGVFLDALIALTGGERGKAKRSTVAGVTLSGVPGTIISEGSQASTAAGDLFQTTGTVIIGSGGTITADFESVEYGAIPATVGAIANVVSDVLGWETVTNPNAAVVGSPRQSDGSARALRRNTLAAQGVALPEAITSGLYLVDGVKSLTFRENYTGSSVTIDGKTLVARSIRVCVDGGSDSDIGAALLAKKSLGADWNGDVTVLVTDPSSGQVYTTKFDRPAYVPVKCRITVRGSTLPVANPSQTIRTIVMNYANGEIDGESGLTVGTSFSPFELSGAIGCAYPGVFVQNVEVAPDDGSTPFSNTTVAINTWQKATLIEGAITVVVI